MKGKFRLYYYLYIIKQCPGSDQENIELGAPTVRNLRQTGKPSKLIA